MTNEEEVKLMEADGLVPLSELDGLTGEIPEKKAASFTEEEEAAARFLYLLPYVKKFGKALGGGAVVRVLHALAEFPLSDDKPRLLSKQEKQMFDIFQELTACKTIIIKFALDKQKQLGEEKNGTEEKV